MSIRWYGHVERSNYRQVQSRQPLTYRLLEAWAWEAKDDMEAADREWKLSAIDPHDRYTWRSGVRSAMRAASQLPGRGPVDVDVAPVPARKSKLMMMMSKDIIQ